MKNSKKFSNIAKKSLAVALAVLSLTGSAQNVSAMESVDQVQNNISDEAGEYWDEFAESSNKNFITGKDENDKEVVGLNDREPAIYKSMKEFILSEEANFGILNENFKTIDLGNIGEGVQCQIKEFTYRNEKPKAFVCVVVPNGRTFTKENMNTIKQKLLKQRLATDGLWFKFENVNLVIRPKTRTAKFEIGENAICGCKNSTINAQGATISGEKAICYFDNATINAKGATISGEEAIYDCGENSTINAKGATISGKHAIHLCDNSTINAQGATISGKFVIRDCKYSKINAQGAIIMEDAISNCHNSTINVNEEQVYDVAHKVHGSINVKINDRSLEEIIAEENEKYSNGERRKDDKETEE